MANDAGPTVIRLQYSTLYGVHSMDLHSRIWEPVTETHPLGTVPNWADDIQVDVQDMIEALVTLFLSFFPVTTTFAVATVLTNDAPGEVLVPRASAALEGLVGTEDTPGWSKAVQQTISVRTEGNGLAKITFLDCASFNSFDPVRFTGAAPDIDDIVAEFSNSLKAWSGADNTQPTTFIGAFKTLNEALRRSYRMI